MDFLIIANELSSFERSYSQLQVIQGATVSRYKAANYWTASCPFDVAASLFSVSHMAAAIAPASACLLTRRDKHQVEKTVWITYCCSESIGSRLQQSSNPMDENNITPAAR